MAAVYLPLLPAFALLLPPVFSLENWRALAADPQLPQSLIATLVSTLIAAVGALLALFGVIHAPVVGFAEGSSLTFVLAYLMMSGMFVVKHVLDSREAASAAAPVSEA